MKKFKFLTDDEINARNLESSNSQIDYINISLLGHFNDAVELEIVLHSKRALFEGYDSTRVVGYLLQTIFSLFELSEEDGRLLDTVVDIPCRIACDDKGNCVAIGHFMQSKWLPIQDFYAHCAAEHDKER